MQRLSDGRRLTIRRRDPAARAHVEFREARIKQDRGTLKSLVGPVFISIERRKSIVEACPFENRQKCQRSLVVRFI